MNINDLEQHLFTQIKTVDKNFKRLFHGRGGCFKEFDFLTVDSIDKVLYVVYFYEINEELESALTGLFLKLFNSSKYLGVVLQKRYLLKEPSQVLFGEIPFENFAYENGLQYKLNIEASRNMGFFADMNNGRNFVSKNAKDKNVLNLFSYTCAFSVVASSAGAKQVVNVDMSKGALTIGRTNHHLNKLSTKNIKFMPYNILKSWSRIKNAGPYDLIIIDPPTFQKGSFIASNDYHKIIKRLSSLCSENCMVLASTNSPDISSLDIIEGFKKDAPEFVFEKRLETLDSFPSINKEKELKNLIFRKIS